MASHDSEARRISDVDRDSKSLRDAVKRSFDETKLDGRRLGRDFPRTLLGEVSKSSYTQQHLGSRREFCISNESPLKQQNHQGSKFSGFNSIKPGVKLPNFDGSSLKLDFLDWIDTIEDYFEAMDPPEDVKCKLVASKLKGEARLWWKELQNLRFSKGKNLITTWPRMSKLLIKKFLHTSRLTYFHKQLMNKKENENNVKHANCSKEVPVEPYSNNQQEWVSESSSFGVAAGMGYGNINVGILEGSTLPKPTTGGTIGRSQLEEIGDEVLVVPPSNTIDHQANEDLKVEDSMGKVHKGDMHGENDRVHVKEMIDENFTSGNCSTKFLNRLSKPYQEEEEAVKQLNVDLDDLESKTHVKCRPLVVTEKLSAKGDDKQPELLFVAFNKYGVSLHQPQLNTAISVFLPVANSDPHLREMIHKKIEKVKDSDKQDEMLMLNFDPGGKWQCKLSMDDGRGHLLHQATSSSQYSNINIKKEKQSRVPHAFNRVINVCDFEVCRQRFNSAEKWCCFPLQLGLITFPLLTTLAQMSNFADMADNGAIRAVRIADVITYMKNILILVVFGDLSVVVYAFEGVRKILSTYNSWMFEACGTLVHSTFGKDTRDKVIANMGRGMVNNRVQSICLSHFISLPVTKNQVYGLVERGCCEGRYCSVVRLVVLRVTLIAILAPNIEDSLSLVGNNDVWGVGLPGVFLSMKILSEIKAELAATKVSSWDLDEADVFLFDPGGCIRSSVNWDIKDYLLPCSKKFAGSIISPMVFTSHLDGVIYMIHLRDIFINKWLHVLYHWLYMQHSLEKVTKMIMSWAYLIHATLLINEQKMFARAGYDGNFLLFMQRGPILEYHNWKGHKPTLVRFSIGDKLLLVLMSKRQVDVTIHENMDLRAEVEFDMIWMSRSSKGIYVSWCNLLTVTGRNQTRGRVIPWDRWNDENNNNIGRKIIMVEISVIICARVNTLCKNGQSRESMKLFHKVVNGLDPPMDLDSACEASMWISTSSLVDELLRRRDGLM